MASDSEYIKVWREKRERRKRVWGFIGAYALILFGGSVLFTPIGGLIALAITIVVVTILTQRRKKI